MTPELARIVALQLEYARLLGDGNPPYRATPEERRRRRELAEQARRSATG